MNCLVKYFSLTLFALGLFFYGLNFAYGADVDYYVDPTGTDDGSHGTGTGTDAWATIAYAIANVANSTTDTITINIAAGTYIQNNVDLSINRSFTNLTLQGAGADSTFIQPAATAGASTSRVIMIGANQTITINDLTVRYGRSETGTGIYQNNYTTSLYLNRCVIDDNDNSTFGGGGISSRGNLYMDSCVVSNNACSEVQCGGGVWIDNNTHPELISKITNSTFYKNSSGGASIAIGLDTHIILTNNTIYQGDADGHGFFNSNNDAYVYMKNNLITDPTGGDYAIDLDYGYAYANKPEIFDGGYNYIETQTGGAKYTFVDGVNGNIVGINPSLNLATSLADNGTTNGLQTLALSEGSVVIDAGNAAAHGPDGNQVTPPALDQRGLNRLSTIDIGAYEYGGSTNNSPSLTSIAASRSYLAGSGSITLTPTGQNDGDSDSLYFYCNESGSATSANTLCDEANTSYASGSYDDMTCSYTASTGNETRTIYCRTYDGVAYGTERTTTYTVDTINPSVNAGSDQNKASQYAQDATVSDSGSGVASYAWTKVSGPGTITFGTANAEDTTVSASVDGSYVLRLTVTDNAGNSASDDFSLTWDSTGPILSNVTASAGSDSATITWTSSESADASLSYGLNSSLGSSSTDATMETSHSLTINSLKSCATYYYRVSSEDALGSSTNSQIKSFATSGCSVSSIASGSGGSVATSGGTVSLSTNSGTAVIAAPEDFYSEAATIQINKLNTDSTPTAPSGSVIISDNFFELKAILGDGTALETFDEPVTFTVSYGSDVEDSYDESTLDVYKYSEGAWVAKDCTLDANANTLTCSLPSFSTYGVFGAEIADEVDDADVNKWEAYLYDKPGTSCPVRLRLEIKGDDFDNDAKVKIGGTKAYDVDVRDGDNKIVARFCMKDLLKVKKSLIRSVSVTNPEANKKKAKKKIDLSKVHYQFEKEAFLPSNPDQILNIQKALASLGFLDSQYITGYYGPITTAAVKNFQAKNELTQSGNFDLETENKLLKKL